MGNQILDDGMAVQNPSGQELTNREFKKLNFPLRFEFKISTFANDFIATDASGKMLAYVRQKMFKFKEDIQIFSDESKTTELYRIKADRWIDFNAHYTFFDQKENPMGSIARKGVRSIWNAHYQIHNAGKEHLYNIQEENPWVKVFDALFGEIPILGMFTGYVFNPKYNVVNLQGENLIRMKKEPSFFGRNFVIEKIGELPDQEDEDVMLALMMFVLLERRRG